MKGKKNGRAVSWRNAAISFELRQLAKNYKLMRISEVEA
jgi:hypothetical protein